MLENRLTAALFGDPETDLHLADAAELAAMIRFEVALAEAEAAQGIIPKAAGPAIAEALQSAEVSAPDLLSGTAAAGVPVPSLVASLRDQVGEPHGSFVHWGATSQDVVDTGWVLRIRSILDLFESRLRKLVEVLADQAEEHAALPMAGRTRTQISTPITLGLRIASWLAPLARCVERLDQMRPRLLLVQLGGASGSLSVLGERGASVAADLAERLQLGCPSKPWHTERDGLVELGCWLATVSGLLGRIGADLSIMGRSEIAEMKAGKAGGSSTMPQKANPVGAEVLLTLSKLTSGHIGTLLQTLVFPEERDGVAWGTEWLTLPPMLSATGAGLRHAVELAETLKPDPAAMQRHMTLGDGAIHAEAIAFALAEHMPLDRAQAIVKAASRESGRSLSDRVAERAALEGTDFDLPDIRTAIWSSEAMTRAAIADARQRLQTPR